MPGTAAGVADRRSRTEIVLHLFGKCGQQRAVEWLVAQLVVHTVDIRVGDCVVALPDS